MNATVEWSANSEPDLAGYRVYHGIVPGQYYESFVVLAPAVQKEFTGLYDWHPHYFAVTAFDNEDPSNESPVSLQVSKHIYIRKQVKLLMGSGT